jgi:hypothetical protein
VARPKRDAHLMALAKRGAEARLSDLAHEAKILIDLFPHLRDNIDRDELPVQFILRQGRDRADARARRSSMSAASRKAVSLRMKKYWAKRKASDTDKK